MTEAQEALMALKDDQNDKQLQLIEEMAQIPMGIPHHCKAEPVE